MTFGRKVCDFVGCCGLLAALFVAVAGPACTPDALRKVEHTADKVDSVVQKARDAADQDCPKATTACALYFDAVKAGFAPDDDRAELACSKVATVCELLGSGGAD